MSLDVLDVVQLGGERVVDINDNDLPVSLLLVEESHDTENLDLLDLARVTDELTDLADIERVVVTLGLGLRVDGVGVLPGLMRQLAMYLESTSDWVNNIPGGRHRSSRGNPCGGSSCGRIEACPS